MKKSIALLTLLSLTLSACGALLEDAPAPLQAQEASPQTTRQLVLQMRRDMFAEDDRNKDGFLAGAELRGKFSREDMAELDRDRDGRLSFKEFEAALDQLAPVEAMVRFLTGMIQACRKAADDNRDGQIDRAEFTQFFSAERQAGAAFTQGDANRDGVLTGSELERAVVWMQARDLKAAR